MGFGSRHSGEYSVPFPGGHCWLWGLQESELGGGEEDWTAGHASALLQSDPAALLGGVFACSVQRGGQAGGVPFWCGVVLLLPVGWEALGGGSVAGTGMDGVWRRAVWLGSSISTVSLHPAGRRHSPGRQHAGSARWPRPGVLLARPDWVWPCAESASWPKRPGLTSRTSLLSWSS